jgi:hypothetical protein
MDVSCGSAREGLAFEALVSFNGRVERMGFMGFKGGKDYRYR